MVVNGCNSWGVLLCKVLLPQIAAARKHCCACYRHGPQTMPFSHETLVNTTPRPQCLYTHSSHLHHQQPALPMLSLPHAWSMHGSTMVGIHQI
jgi:hypothetical protein